MNNGFRYVCALLVFAAAQASAQDDRSTLPKSVINWNPKASEQCLLAPFINAETDAQRTLVGLVGRLDTSPVRLKMIQNLYDMNVALCIENRPVVARGYFDVDANLIALHHDLDVDEMLLILIHELRHLDQFQRGFCPTIDFDVQEMVRFTFAIEADAQAVTTFIAWQLAQSGQPGPWAALSALEKYADIAKRFETEVNSGIAPNLAISSAFEQWYASNWRVDNYYLASCSDYLDRLDETKKLRSYQLLPNDYFDSLCLLPDGTKYDCDAKSDN